MVRGVTKGVKRRGDAAPPPKRKPGRPRVSTFSPLEMTAEQVERMLGTKDGIARARAELYVRVSRGGTALELAAMGLAKRILDRAAAAVIDGDVAEQSQELVAGLAEMSRQLGARQGNALRADMATAPPPARRPGTLQ